MSKKKNKRVTLKIQKKPFLERLGKIFTGPTNLDIEEQQRRLNPPNTVPRGKNKWELRNRRKVDVDPKTGEKRLIENITKPHYSEIDQFPYTDDPTFKNEMATQYIIEQRKTRQWIENVLRQNKDNLKLPQSKQDFEIRKQINTLAEDFIFWRDADEKRFGAAKREEWRFKKVVYTPPDLERKKRIDATRKFLPVIRNVDNLITNLTTPTGAEAQFLKYKKDLHPEIRKKLQLQFPKKTSEVVIPTKNVEGKTGTPQLGRIKYQPRKPTVTSPESVNTKIKHGYGDKLRVEALRTDPNFKNLSPPAQQRYLEFMHKQIKNNQPMDRSLIKSWMGKDLSLTQKIQKDYIQSRRLKVINEELRKLNREEKAAGRKGDKIRTIIKGINKPKRGK